MKQKEDDSLNEHAAAGSKNVHPTRDDPGLAAATGRSPGEDSAMLDWLAKFAGLKVYIHGHGWVALNRPGIRSAMAGQSQPVQPLRLDIGPKG